MICGVSAMALLTITHIQSLEILGQSYVPAIGLITSVVGSYLPDIDIQQSKAGQQFKFISKFLTHRGITHTLLVPAILAVAMYYLNVIAIPIIPSLLLGLEVGWLAHIVADIFNRKGVPILWPIYPKKIHLACFKTGTWHEYVFIVLWIGGLIGCYFLIT